MKRQVAMPRYETVYEYGNLHNKSILVSVKVADQVFEPANSSPYKKHAKAMCAAKALKELGWVKDEEGVQEGSQEADVEGEEEGQVEGVGEGKVDEEQEGEGEREGQGEETEESERAAA